MSTSAREREFRTVYDEWSGGQLTQPAAAARLMMGERTFRRYVARVREEGFGWLREGTSRRAHGRRAPDEERASLEKLFSDQYSGWNIRHFYEWYRSEHGGKRSYSWVKDCLQAAGLVEQRARGPVQQRRRGRNERKPVGQTTREGMLLHNIASRHEWVTGHMWDLSLVVDDATRRVYSGFFVEERGIWSTLNGIRDGLERGLFDRFSMALAVPARLTPRESAFGGPTRPQVERVMVELGIQMVAPDPSVSKRNARMLRTLRNRIPQELAREYRDDDVRVSRANGYLGHFWARYNTSQAVKPVEPSDAFVPLGPEFLEKVTEQVFCLKHEARVCNGDLLVNGSRRLAIATLGCSLLSSGDRFRLHEYEDGRCVLFDGQDTVAEFHVRELGRPQ
ncbi:MAG: hypothetical protein OXN92_00940 [Gammaproteobacteria bacterium]|nr:hypothetical protein [Gammaproteobacteria bacterium]